MRPLADHNAAVEFGIDQSNPLCYSAQCDSLGYYDAGSIHVDDAEVEVEHPVNTNVKVDPESMWIDQQLATHQQATPNAALCIAPLTWILA